MRVINPLVYGIFTIIGTIIVLSITIASLLVATALWVMNAVSKFTHGNLQSSFQTSFRNHDGSRRAEDEP